MSHELHQEQLQVERLAERAILVACHLPDSHYDERDPLGELRELTRTAGAEVVGELIQKRHKPDNGTFLGKGKIEELRLLKDELEATLIIFDQELTPSQIRNIEKVVQGKIIDRSELILDIFAGRATTHQAKLQVELAQLEYTYPRLRAMWTHFGQIAGGAPVGIGTRGPGETQIETDRRLVQRRKTVLRKRLQELQQRRVREVAQRTKAHFTVCLVGYTNAGKSTLFNALTLPAGGGGAYADDRLFATLTTRTRRWQIGSVDEENNSSAAQSNRVGRNDEVMLSDTVGFVRDLPHHLIASFRATLEEAIHADVLIIVIDVSDMQAHYHYEVVTETLDRLETDYENTVRKSGLLGDGVNTDNREREDDFSHLGLPNEKAGERIVRHPKRVVVLNKTDLLTDQSELAVWNAVEREAIAVSALSGEGLYLLRERVSAIYHGGVSEYEVVMPFSKGKALSYAEHRGEVIERKYEGNQVILRVRLGQRHAEQLRIMGVAVEQR